MNKKYPIDLGDKFGSYTVVGKEVDRRNRTVYMLRCYCGNTAKKIGSLVVKSQSCQKCAVNKVVGSKNHRVRFLEYLGKGRFRCLCDCGHVYEGRARSKSCGCHLVEAHVKKAKKLEGYRFGIIKILRFLRFRHNARGAKNSVYLAKCKCGNSFEIARPRVDSVHSCGCSRPSTHAKGQYQGSAKYLDQDVRSALDLYLTGEYTRREVASITGISDSCLKDVISGRTRKHIGADPNVLNESPLKHLYRNPRKFVNIVSGQRFNSWTALEKTETKHRQAYWICKCVCGRTAKVCKSSLTHGRSKQCQQCALKNLIAARRARKTTSNN